MSLRIDRKGFFRPKLLDCLSGYTSSQFFADLAAGLTVGIVALPLAMAFAIASGVKPEAGIFTAVIAGFIISALGGSRVQIGGPTGAFIIIVYGILVKYGAANLAICTMMAGCMLLIMGMTGLGAAIKFIPYPVTMGFNKMTIHNIRLFIRGKPINLANEPRLTGKVRPRRTLRAKRTRTDRK